MPRKLYEIIINILPANLLKINEENFPNDRIENNLKLLLIKVFSYFISSTSARNREILGMGN